MKKQDERGKFIKLKADPSEIIKAMKLDEKKWNEQYPYQQK
jgi:hypothetical protein